MVAKNRHWNVRSTLVLLRPLSVLIGLLLCGACLATPTTRPESGDIASLIRGLSDRDSAVRERAGEKLAALGVAARPALLEAVRHGDPERRSRLPPF